MQPRMTQHTVVLVVDKRERAISMQTLLTKLGYKVVLAFSLYEAIKSVEQEMPHLVITESLLSDGTAGTLFDRLQRHETLHRTPIVVVVQRKTREELAPLTARQFAGLVLGPVDARSFLAKVEEVMATHSPQSPYFAKTEELGLKPAVKIWINAQVIGHKDGQLVVRSGSEMDPLAKVLCVPLSPDQSPAVLRMATNMREGEEVYNLFPLSRIVGAGCKWALSLPEIKGAGAQTGAAAALHRVVFCEPDAARFARFRAILKGYGMDLIHAASPAAVLDIVRQGGASIDAVYLAELPGAAAGGAWKAAYDKLPEDRCPPLIVGTTGNESVLNGVRFIKKPFGLGLFVELLQASFERGAELARVVGKGATTQLAGIPVRYEAAATLIGLDETGGILQVPFPLLTGSRLCIDHEFLTAAWDDDEPVKVTSVASNPDMPDTWLVRFESAKVATSKVKYWEKLTKMLRQMQGDKAVAPDGFKEASGDQ